jgi:hypothetical protein
MTWRIAESLEVLRRQLNSAFPNRSKVSDGGIGDEAHASRDSDHNPWFKDKKGVGIVSARDFTHDPKGGLDCHWLARQLVKARDSRIKYIIWNGQICSSRVQPWVWRPYKGKNAHKHHLHLSVNSESFLFDNANPWDLGLAKPLADLTDKEIEKTVDKVSAAAPLQTVQTSNPSDSSVSGTPNPTAQEPPPNATEQTAISAPSGETKVVEQKNEQPVDVPAQVPEPAPQGIAAKLKAGIGTLFGGTIVYTVAEKFGAMSFSTQAIILFSVVAAIALIGFMFWAWLDAWKSAKKTELTAMANTDKNRRDIQWVKE